MEDALVLVCPGCKHETSEFRPIKTLIPTTKPLLACPECQSGYPLTQWRKPDDLPPAHVDTPVLLGQA